MAASGFTPIQLYRTSTASAVPVNTNLADGELAINLTDEILYFKNAAGTVKFLSANITPVANGGTGATAAPAARTNLGATTLGGNLFTITNPGAVTFPRFNADNTVSALDAASFRTAIGAGTGGGSVTSVGGTGTVNGITLTGTVTSSGNLTLGGTLSGVSLTSQVTGTLPVANGGTNRASLVAGSVLVGNGTAAVSLIAPSTVGNVLTSTGTTWTSAAPSGGSSFSVKTANYTAISGDNLLADTSAGSFTITLPATPATGAVITIEDSAQTFSTNPLLVARNGNTIMGLAEDMWASINGAFFTLIYNGSTWRMA